MIFSKIDICSQNETISCVDFLNINDVLLVKKSVVYKHKKTDAAWLIGSLFQVDYSLLIIPTTYLYSNTPIKNI